MQGNIRSAARLAEYCSVVVDLGVDVFPIIRIEGSLEKLHLVLCRYFLGAEGIELVLEISVLRLSIKQQVQNTSVVPCTGHQY